MPLITRLRHTGVIPEDILRKTELDMRAGGTVINHLHRHLGDGTDEVWAALAKRSGRLFLPTPAAAGPIDARLLPLYPALDHLVVPRVRRLCDIHLISPDPLARLSDFAALRPLFVKLVPGGQPHLRIDLAPPAAFRELFALTYPDARKHYRDTADAAALAALLPRAHWKNHTPTPEEEADAMATLLGLPYIDPETYPAQVDALAGHPPQPFLTRRLFPHSRNEHGQLVVLGTLRRAEELPELTRKVQDLADALSQPLLLALTSTRRIVRLIKTRHEAPHE
jgi:hypothetical protein